MSQAFMYAVAAMYLAAMVSFAHDGKVLWAALCLSWAIGNFLIGFISAST